MSIVKSDRCWTASEYLNHILDYSDEEVPEKGNITYDEFNRIREKHDEICLWDYPLTEIEHILNENIPVVLVAFETAIPGIPEHRFCETTE